LMPQSNQISSHPEKQVDLFSEIHLNQMKKLEKQLEGMECERNGLTKSLKEIQDQVEKSKGQVSTLQAALATIVSHIEALNSLKDETSLKIGSSGQSANNINVMSTYQGWFTVSSKEIGELKAALEAIEKADSGLIPDVVAALKTEMRNVKEKLLSYEVKMEELSLEMTSMDESAADAHKTLDATQTELNLVSEELANLYYKVCNVQGVTPQRVMLDHMDKGKVYLNSKCILMGFVITESPFDFSDGKVNSPAKSLGFQGGNNHLLGLLGRLRPKTGSPSGNWEGDLTFAKQVETILDQVSAVPYH